MPKISQKFDHRIKQPEPHIVAFLTAIDEIKGAFRASLNMTPQAITSLRRSVIVTSAGASTRIEGSKLSDEEVKKIMQGMSIQKFSDRDSQEVQGYLEVLQNVFDGYQGLSLREGTIKSLHKATLKYSTKDDLHRGEYKHKENIVGMLDGSGKIAKIIFETTPAWQTPKEMTELVEWTYEALERERFHPLLIICNFIIEFLKIHPFEDGNGRLSRILTNMLLLKSGYSFVQYVSHEQIIEKRKDEYYFALRKSQESFGNPEKETIVPWLNFFLSVIKEQAAKSMELAQGDANDDMLSQKQNQILAHIAEVASASPIEIAAATGIVLPTVRKSLMRLVKIGRIKAIGLGRGTRYVKL
jgi:Fic family protein